MGVITIGVILGRTGLWVFLGVLEWRVSWLCSRKCRCRGRRGILLGLCGRGISSSRIITSPGHLDS